MSKHNEVGESPNHFMVLDAISRGINSLDKIVVSTKLQKDLVELILNDLLTQRLIVKSEKKGLFFGRKKTQMGITETGIKLLNAKKQELEQKRLEMQQSYDNEDGTRLQSYMNANRTWIPLMLFSGIMDMMFFTSMMSFVGLGINPMESAILGGGETGNSQDAGSSGDTQSIDHRGETSSDTKSDDTTNNDNSDYNNGDFDSGGGGGGFDGFDGGGGFDGF
jgi:hypothetical protein